MVGQKHNATVGGDMQEQIKGLRKSIAGAGQSLIAPKNHVGSESINIFKVLCDTLDLIEQMAVQIAAMSMAQVLCQLMLQSFQWMQERRRLYRQH